MEAVTEIVIGAVLGLAIWICGGLYLSWQHEMSLRRKLRHRYGQGEENE